MPVTPFGATVREAGGGWVTMIVDRDAVEYPAVGEHVVVAPTVDADTGLADALLAEAARWEQVVALLGPDVLEDIAAGRIVRHDPAVAHDPVVGWITPEDLRRVQAAPAEGHSRWVPIRTHRDDSYTIPLQASPPAAPRTVRVPWATAVEQQLTAVSTDGVPREVSGAAVFDGQVELTDRHDRSIAPVGDDGMVEVLDDGSGGVVVPPTPICGTCDDTGRVPAGGHGGDGYDPCPYCVGHPDDQPS